MQKINQMHSNKSFFTQQSIEKVKPSVFTCDGRKRWENTLKFINSESILIFPVPIGQLQGKVCDVIDMTLILDQCHDDCSRELLGTAREINVEAIPYLIYIY